MNNKFESKSEAHAKQYLTEMFEAGNVWHDGTRDFKSLDRKYFFFDKGIHTSNNALDWDYYDYPLYELKNPPEGKAENKTELRPYQENLIDVFESKLAKKLKEPKEPKVKLEVKWVQQGGRGGRFLTPDFSNVQVGDKVKCIMHGDGVVEQITDDPLFPIVVMLKSYRRSYSIKGFNRVANNPTLFYPFSGQFPTAEACVRPKPDPYELHGVTREEIKKYADAVEVIQGWCCKMITFNDNGRAFAFSDDCPKSSTTGGWTHHGARYIKIPSLNRPAPYEHWETPIILGGES